MTQADFLEKAAEVLEVESVTAETRFRDLPDWCSLQAFGLLVLLENECGIRMDLESFRRCETLGDLCHG